MLLLSFIVFFFFSSRRRHTRYWRDWSSDVCSSDLSDECGQCAAARAPCGSQTRWVHIRPSEEIIGGSFGIPNKKAGYAFAHQEALRSCLNVLVDGPSRQGPVDLAIVGLLPFALSNRIEGQYHKTF